MSTILQQLSIDQCEQFSDAIKAAGINTDPWWEAVLYPGPPKVLQVGLLKRESWFRKRLIAVGNDLEGLQTLARYIRHNPKCQSWRLYCQRGQWQLDRGDFAIVQRGGFRGGDRELVADLLQSFGIAQELIDEMWNERTAETLGYVLASTARQAQELAQITEIGATTPSAEGAIALCKVLAKTTGVRAFEQAIVVANRLIIPALAETYFSNGHYELAACAFAQRIRLNPNDVAGYNGLGLAYAEIHEYEDALQAFQAAVRIAPQCAEAYMNLGTTYDRLKQYDAAIEAHTTAVQLRPDCAEAHFSLAVTYSHIDRQSEAVDAYQKALSTKPDYAEAHYGLGLSYSSLNRGHEAVSAFERAISAAPNFTMAHFMLGIQYMRCGDKESAMRECKALRSSDPDLSEKLLCWIERRRLEDTQPVTPQ